MLGRGSVQEGVEGGFSESRKRRRVATAVGRARTLDLLQSASNSLELLLSLLLIVNLEPRVGVRGAAVWKREPCNRDI